MKHLYILALMQPYYALLPGTSYPKTAGGMCYAIKVKPKFWFGFFGVLEPAIGFLTTLHFNS